MTLSYLLRLFCVSLASFFLIQAVLSLVVAATAPAAIRRITQFAPRAAAALLLALRLAPAALALVFVLAFCIPSFLWLEPSSTAEFVGYVCLAAGIAGLGLWTASTVRALRATLSSSRFLRDCSRIGSKVEISESLSALVLETDSPVLALVGVIRPRLVISRKVLESLTPEQLDAAVRHENAHRSSRDNLKRLLALLAPSAPPFSARFSLLDRAWQRFAEWAADDHAVESDPHRSATLAAALVSVARLGTPLALSPLATSLVPDHGDLAARVERLLEDPPPNAAAPVARNRFIFSLLTCTALFAVAFARPETLRAVHELLERLVR